MWEKELFMIHCMRVSGYGRSKLTSSSPPSVAAGLLVFSRAGMSVGQAHEKDVCQWVSWCNKQEMNHTRQPRHQQTRKDECSERMTCHVGESIFRGSTTNTTQPPNQPTTHLCAHAPTRPESVQVRLPHHRKVQGEIRQEGRHGSARWRWKWHEKCWPGLPSHALTPHTILSFTPPHHPNFVVTRGKGNNSRTPNQPK